MFQFNQTPFEEYLTGKRQYNGKLFNMDKMYITYFCKKTHHNLESWHSV